MPQQRVNQLTPRRKKSDGGVLAQSSSSAAATTKQQQSSHNKNLQQNANDEERPTCMIDTTNMSTTATDKEMNANDNMNTSLSNTTEEDDGSSSDSDDESQDSEQQPSNSNATNNTNSKSSQLTPSERDELSKTLTLPPNINHINELSDYEILRLRNIQRNEAKLASLGLFAGITSKNGNGNKGKKKNTSPKSAAAIKAANTRRRNAEKAKLMIENHEKWQRSQQQISMELNGDNTNTSTAIYASFKGSSTSYYRSQPSRTAKSKSISYTTSPQHKTTPKRIQQWHTNLSLLKAYHSTHQSYNISRTIQNGKYKPLADWLNRQRIQYNKYKNNEKHTLDNERVSLLEGLNGVWWKRTRANSSSNGGRVRSRKREVSFGKSRGKDINIARQLWNDRMNQEDISSSTSDDDTSILDKMEREVYSDSESEYGRLSPKKEEASYYYDSYSDEYESDDYSRRGDDDMVTARSRRGRGYESEDDSCVEDYYNRKQPSIKKKRSNNSTNNTTSRRMSSLEQVAPVEKVSHHTRSPKRRRKSSKRRKRSNEDYYDQYDDRRRRSYSPQYQSRHEFDRRRRSSRSSRRRPFYDDERSLMSEEEEITSQEEEDTNSASLMIEEEHYIRRSSQKRKRVRRRNSNDDDYHRPHRGGGSELVRQQKPMNEIIISPSNTGTTVAAQSTTTTLSTLERNKLLAEYGKLYERQCYIYERKTRLELELRAIHSMLLENNRKSEMRSANIEMIGNGGGGGMLIGGGSRLVGSLGSANKLLTAGDK